jgi:lipoprotein-anchoring transpeptidase ErfK/SrfK
MEVLMGRYGRRVSRSLIGVLLVTLVLGLAFYLKNTNRTQAEESNTAAVEAARRPELKATAPMASAEKPPAPATRPVVAAAPATQPLVVTQTPTLAEPTTRPMLASNNSNPTTAPTASAAPAISGNVLAEARAKKDADQLLAARTMLNDALLSGRLSSPDTDAAKAMLSEINKSMVFSPRRFADDPFGGTYSVQPGDVLQKIASRYEVTWEALARLNNMSDPKKLRAGQTIKVVHGPFHAVVSKSHFTMDIYLGPPGEKGSMYVTTFPVGLGKDDSTPTGTFLVEPQKKLKNPTYYSPRGEGVIDADDPKNPLGERWVGLTGIDGHAIGKESYGIHGTIDETSIGKMESMGCIRMHNADVEWVFDLMVEGKSLVIVKE